jgi:NitT/TauT family transport system ATP-binding protein
MRSVLPGAAVVLRGAGVHFGAGRTAVEALAGIDLDIAPGELVSLVGPSGCGKSTIVGAVAGFLPLASGQLLVAGQPVRSPGPDRGVVFQQPTLFPWKTAAGNVEFGLKMQGMGRAERRRVAREMLERVGLRDFLHHYPHQLSGGMQQRVGLARALVTRPRVLLMDEPFCSLDAQTRIQMQQLLLGLWDELRMSVVFVTHDVDEALLLGERVVVLSARPARVRADIPVALPAPAPTRPSPAPSSCASSARS